MNANLYARDILDLAQAVSALALRLSALPQRQFVDASGLTLQQAAQALDLAGQALCEAPGFVAAGAGLIAASEALNEIIERRPWPAPGPATVSRSAPQAFPPPPPG